MIKTKVTLAIYLVGFVLTASALHPATTLAADLVVAEARGVPLQPGQIIDGTKNFVLTEGQEVVLIAPTGKTVTLIGPYDAPPASVDDSRSPVDVGAALRALASQSSPDNQEIAVVRGTEPDVVVPPEPWLIDVTHTGSRCLPAGSAIIFWRPHTIGTVSFTISPYDRSWQAHGEWPDGSDRFVMPRTVSLQDHSNYFIDIGGEETAITLIVIPLTINNDAMRFAWMTLAECDGQARALLQSVK